MYLFFIYIIQDYNVLISIYLIYFQYTYNSGKISRLRNSKVCRKRYYHKNEDNFDNISSPINYHNSTHRNNFFDSNSNQPNIKKNKNSIPIFKFIKSKKVLLKI